MSDYSMAEARKHLTDLVGRVAYGHERITIGRRNKDMAVLVPIEDARLLEELEDRRDADEARKILKRETERVPWEQVKKELGIRINPSPKKKTPKRA